jgi:hypothetical protein
VTRAAVAAALAGVALAVAAAPPALAAKYTLRLSGSIHHDWSVTTTDPCAAVGPGSIVSTFTSAHSETLTARTNRFGPFADYEPTILLHGTITATDDTTQNPPELAGETCTPTDKSGCQKVSLAQSAAINLETPQLGSPQWSVVGSNFLNAFDRFDAKCNDGLMYDFTDINAHHVDLKVSLPSLKRLAAGKGAGSYHLHDHRTDHLGPIEATTTRDVTFTLARQR